ncbi:protein disulfide oxidoreductase [Microbulbifer variabilis]|uniref:protein disulfide oxidoreductase n=1 Tax=Microbulbifer variabilis TaxID=266805 RepID=UPI001CFE7101|nr:protein disulfide oxidoreductase [Microbulbifer variabilis]
MHILWYRFTVKLVIFSILAILVMAAVAYYQQRDIPRDLAPSLKGETLNGNLMDLEHMTTHGPVLIYFWGSWCPYCRIVSPKISELAREYQVLGVAMQSGEEDVVKEYMLQHNLKFPTINDPMGSISAQWGIKVTPTIIIVGSDGKISWVTSGATSKLGLKLRMELTE